MLHSIDYIDGWERRGKKAANGKCKIICGSSSIWFTYYYVRRLINCSLLLLLFSIYSIRGTCTNIQRDELLNTLSKHHKTMRNERRKKVRREAKPIQQIGSNPLTSNIFFFFSVSSNGVPWDVKQAKMEIFQFFPSCIFNFNFYRHHQCPIHTITLKPTSVYLSNAEAE